MASRLRVRTVVVRDLLDRRRASAGVVARAKKPKYFSTALADRPNAASIGPRRAVTTVR
jgi:hypothetical protein